MSSASTGEPRIGEPPPFTRSDLDTARRMVRRRGAADEADDVAQEVAIAAARYSRPIAVPPGHAPAEARRFVMSGIARRQVAHHRAERARRRARGGEPVGAREEARILERLHGAGPSAEDRILERSRITLLRAAVAELQSEAPELYPVMKGKLDGLSIPLVAAQLGIPLATAYTRARRGRAAVRTKLRQWEEGDAQGAIRMRLDAEKRARAPRTRAAAQEPTR